jgi:hypothetical protein
MNGTIASDEQPQPGGDHRMAEHDPPAFTELFAAEPNDTASPETARWVELYQKLVAMMERQLEETRSFATSSPDAMRQYLSRQNIAILEEEIEAFKSRLRHWTNAGAAQQ